MDNPNQQGNLEFRKEALRHANAWQTTAPVIHTQSALLILLWPPTAPEGTLLLLLLLLEVEPALQELAIHAVPQPSKPLLCCQALALPRS